MKKNFFFAGIASLFIIMATAFMPAPPPPGSSINGQAAILAPYMNGQVQTFSFHARKAADGSVSGSLESNSPGQDIRIHANINCFSILADGKTAIVTAVVTQRTGAGFPGLNVGDQVYFKIQDNGEGAGNNADKFSDYGQINANCGVNVNLFMNNIVNGNIQVKP